MCIEVTHARSHARRSQATIFKKKPRSLTLVLDSFVPSALSHGSGKNGVNIPQELESVVVR